MGEFAQKLHGSFKIFQDALARRLPPSPFRVEFYSFDDKLQNYFQRVAVLRRMSGNEKVRKKNKPQNSYYLFCCRTYV